MNDQGDAEADRQHEQAHSEPFGEGVLFSVCGAPIGPVWRIHVAVLVAPAGLVGQGGERLVQFPHECLPVEPDLEDAGTIPQTAGSGYLPPHQADTGRMDAGKAYALRKGMANLDRRI